MVLPMRSKALLSKSVQLKTQAIFEALPVRIGDLEGGELTSHCDCCGRHLRLYPGHADFNSRLKLVSLLGRRVCGAHRNGRACGGRPRRLLLVLDERQWMLDATGEWREDESQFWEPADFEALAERRVGPAAG
jgi:hypothetical protein